MTLSQDEYYLLSELIGMDDRKLAQKIELLIWPSTTIIKMGVVDVMVIEACIKLMNESPIAIEFYRDLPALVDKLAKERNILFDEMKSSDSYKCGLQGSNKVTLGKPHINSRGELI